MSDRRQAELYEQQRYELEKRWLLDDPAYEQWSIEYEEELNKWQSLQATKAEPISSPYLRERISASA
jgi:hypothetical protein